LEKHLKLIEERLSIFNFGTEPASLYEPIRYILSLGGKRLRPVLTLMSCQLFDDQFEKAIYPALGVEVFHNFTLLHDDIMDNAPIRRGMPTVHEKWNANIAILSGDVMLVKAYDLFLKSDYADLQKMLSKFSKCAAEVCEGQQYDMNFESNDVVSELEYLEMIRLKTAVLLGFSMELGAMIGGASDLESSQLYEFGINIGLGFQLKDDLLDVYADTTKFGKQIGGDIISNKKTYLLIKALELAQGKDKSNLNFWLKQKEFNADEKVKAVIDVYNSLGIKKLSELKMNAYFDIGLQLLQDLDVDPLKKKSLEKLVLNLIDREK
jgi:geranylgeranyl diphosphate synthase type II